MTVTAIEAHQDIFNRAYLGLASQHFERSMNADQTKCMYRGECGRRCAIGWCIPDEDYTPTFETLAIRHAIDGSRALQERFANIDPNFLSLMQRAHDGYLPSEMRERLEVLAANYGLTIPEIPVTA